MHYRMKAVIFDIQAECKELKEELHKAEILVLEPFLGLGITDTLLQETKQNHILPEECLFLTNRALHASAAKGCGMAVVGCIEGHFEMPKTGTLLESPEEVSVSYLDKVYCHEKGLPAVILETPRLLIKELSGSDAATLYDILAKEEVGRYLPAKEGTQEEELEKLCSYASCVYSFFEYGYWGVFLKKTGELIGRAGFKEGSYPPEAGYLIDSDRWGNGFGTEVLEHLLLYAREEIDCGEIHAKIHKENQASARVAEKCGFSVMPANGQDEVILYRYLM